MPSEPSSDLWRRADRLVEEALDRPTSEREAFLDAACEGDSELRLEAGELLAADAAAEGFLERPVARVQGSSEPELGEHFGPYRLVRLLGRGGMGTVYLAERDDSEYHRQVALKILRGDGSEHPELRERFRFERQVLAGLNHPNIARLYDGDTSADGRAYLVMELVEGEPIDAYCDRHRLSIAERLQLFRQVCATVHHAHRNLVVHRDLKPANLLVTADGTPKLLDFGIAKLLDTGQGVAAPATRTGLRPMTPEYASPEQVRGEAVTTASDIYALGLLLHHLLAGRSPYRLSEGHVLALERAILKQDPDKPSTALERVEAEPSAGAIAQARRTTTRELARQLSGDLDTIVSVALRKDPERRYGSAQQLADDLERHLTNLPVLARPDTFGYRFSKLVRRYPVEVFGSALMAFVLLVFTFLTALQAQRLARQRDVAEHQRIKAEQVSDLLTDLLEGADPYKTRGAEVTVREVLDRGAENLERIADQPDTQAASLRTIGNVYRNLGLYEEARPLLEKAVEIYRELERQGAETGAEIAAGLYDTALIYYELGDLEQAEPRIQESLALRQALYGDDHAEVAASLSGLGSIQHALGLYDEAEAIQRRALAMRIVAFGKNDLKVAESHNNLALLVHERGDYEAAEPLYRESLKVRRELLGNDHPLVSIVLNNLAGLLHDKGDYSGAEPLYREAMELRRAALGDDHPLISSVMGNLAVLLYDRGDLEAAEKLFRETVSLKRVALGSDHPSVAISLSSLARTFLALGAVDEAEASIREALEILRTRLPKGYWRTIYSEAVLGACLTRRGLFAEAEPLLVGAHVELARLIGEREARTRDAVALLIEHYEARGLDAEAEALQILLAEDPA